MEIDMDKRHWEHGPCPKHDCRKDSCKCGLRLVSFPAALGDDSKGSPVAPKNGDYCNALVKYESNGHIYIYSTEGVPERLSSDGTLNFEDLLNRPKYDGRTMTGETNIPKAPSAVSQLANDLGFQTGGEVNSVVTSAVATEATVRRNADNGLQSQIDAITVSSDVVDILGTYADLEAYDTSHIKANDIVKVIQDETHDDTISYYRWVVTNNVGAWSYIGSEGPFYTRSAIDAALEEIDTELGTKTDTQVTDFMRECSNADSMVYATDKHTLEDFDFISAFAPTITNGTHQGVTYTQSDGVVTISGTSNASNASFRNLVGSTSSIPSVFVKERTYSLQFDSTDPNIYVQISIRNGSTVICSWHTNTFPFNFYLPAEATGLLIRFFVRANTTVNGTVSNMKLFRVTDSFLKPTGDTTDRTTEIVANLTRTGVCKLDPGVFYVKNLDMPANSTIYGCGKGTILRLLDSNDAEYAISTATNTSIYNLTIEGSDTDITLENNKTIERYGIKHAAHYVSPDLTTTKLFVQISNLFIRRFTGSGIYQEDTGLPTDSGFCADNIRIANCNVGINIPYSGEYNKFNCVDITRCYYGIINNGSSNVFVGGSISSCYIGIFTQSDGENTPNIGHQVYSGCTFNHYYGSNGTANKGVLCSISGSPATPSITFVGCNIAYGSVNLTGVHGVIFDTCQIGAQLTFNITGGKLVLFTSNVSRNTSEPTFNITNNTSVKFYNNFSRTGPAWPQNNSALVASDYEYLGTMATISQINGLVDAINSALGTSLSHIGE